MIDRFFSFDLRSRFSVEFYLASASRRGPARPKKRNRRRVLGGPDLEADVLDFQTAEIALDRADRRVFGQVDRRPRARSLDRRRPPASPSTATTTQQSASRVCRGVASATRRRRRWSRGATRTRRQARCRTTRYARERCRGRRGPGVARPPLLPSENHFARTHRAVSRPRPSRADTPAPLANARRSSATRSRNPCRRAMSCRTGACARFCPSSWRRRRRRCVPARSFDALRERHGAVVRDIHDPSALAIELGSVPRRATRRRERHLSRNTLPRSR